MSLAMTMLLFGLFVLLGAVVLMNSQRRSRLHLRRLRTQVERTEDALRTPQEREARRRATEAIEAEKREIHGRFDSGGC